MIPGQNLLAVASNKHIAASQHVTSA